MSERQKDIVDFLDPKYRAEKSSQKLSQSPPQSREELVERLIELRQLGWIQTRNQVNDGLVGNTLEDYLGVKENNLTLPDVGKYELKSQRLETSSLTTLIHLDPHPRKPKSVVTKVLGPIYGWPHETLKGQWSFRITMYGNRFTNRGFKIAVNEAQKKLVVEFDPEQVDASLGEWLDQVIKKGGRILNPQPYWPLEEIRKKTERKITNAIYVRAESRKNGPFEEFKYTTAVIYEGFDFEKLKTGIKEGQLFVDFDARTTHNHGTKFRIKKGTLNDYYLKEQKLF